MSAGNIVPKKVKMALYPPGRYVAVVSQAPRITLYVALFINEFCAHVDDEKYSTMT